MLAFHEQANRDQVVANGPKLDLRGDADPVQTAFLFLVHDVVLFDIALRAAENAFIDNLLVLDQQSHGHERAHGLFHRVAQRIFQRIAPAGLRACHGHARGGHFADPCLGAHGGGAEQYGCGYKEQYETRWDHSHVIVSAARWRVAGLRGADRIRILPLAKKQAKRPRW